MTVAKMLVFGGEVIGFRERRTSRRKTVSLSYGSDGLEVLAPHDMSNDQVQQHVQAKAKWILAKRATWSEIGGERAPHEFCAGESHLYLGRAYRLRLVSPDEGVASRTKMLGGFLHVPVRNFEESAQQSLEVRRKLKLWYREKAALKLSQRTSVYAKKLAVPTPSLRLHDQQKRWGSCDKHGRLRFNWRIIMAPLPLVDYVVAHELCHILEFNHSRQFWRLLETIYPETQRARERLRVEGGKYFF